MTIKKLTQHALLNIHNDLEEKNIYEKLDQSFMADVNQNYNIMHQEIYDTIEKHTLKKIVKSNTVVPATAGPLGERPPALAGHFCDVPTNLPC